MSNRERRPVPLKSDTPGLYTMQSGSQPVPEQFNTHPPVSTPTLSNATHALSVPVPAQGHALCQSTYPDHVCSSSQHQQSGFVHARTDDGKGTTAQYRSSWWGVSRWRPGESV